MARQFNGTSDSLQSVSTVSLGGNFACSISLWLWLDSFNINDKMALESGVGGSVGSFFVDPNHNSGRFELADAGGAGFASRGFTRPSTGAWHHYVAVFDFAQTGAAEVVAGYVDGVLQSLTTGSTANNAGPFQALTWNFMSRNNSTLFCAGREAEVAAWAPTQLAQADVDALYNSGAGALANTVQSGTLLHYWRILGDENPEPATVGGVNLTVNGTTKVAHPFGEVGVPIYPITRSYFTP